MWVLSAELVLNVGLNLASMDTKFSAGGDGSHPGAASAAVLFSIPASIPIYAARAFQSQNLCHSIIVWDVLIPVLESV